jgi:hypothetical protein
MLRLEDEEVSRSCKQGANLPPSYKGICTNMTMLNFLVAELTQIPLPSLLEHVMGIFFTIGTHCMRFQPSRKMVVKL